MKTQHVLMAAAVALAMLPAAALAQNVEDQGKGDGLRVAYYLSLIHI